MGREKSGSASVFDALLSDSQRQFDALVGGPGRATRQGPPDQPATQDPEPTAAPEGVLSADLNGVPFTFEPNASKNKD